MSWHLRHLQQGNVLILRLREQDYTRGSRGAGETSYTDQTVRSDLIRRIFGRIFDSAMRRSFDLVKHSEISPSFLLCRYRMTKSSSGGVFHEGWHSPIIQQALSM